MRKGVLALTALLSLAVTVSGCSAPPKAAVSPEQPAPVSEETVKVGPFAGMQAPDLTLKDLDGTEWTLSALKGNSVALIFFTSW